MKLDEARTIGSFDSRKNIIDYSNMAFKNRCLALVTLFFVDH